MDFTLHLAINLPHLDWAAVAALAGVASALAAVATWKELRKSRK